jgi:hypothetical protein
MLASMNDNAAVMDILLRHGAIINEKDEVGLSWWIWSVRVVLRCSHNHNPFREERRL